VDSDTGKGSSERANRMRSLISHGFTGFEDAAYVGLGLLLGLSAIVLLATGAKALWLGMVAGAPLEVMTNLLDRLLLVLMIVELLYTVQVSFKAHALVPEPFLVVSLIAATRRILVVTAQFSRLVEQRNAEQFRNAMIEVGLLTVMVVALVASLRMLQKAQIKADRAP
jgi:hypothetical protein